MSLWNSSLVMYGGRQTFGYSESDILNKIRHFFQIKSLEYYWWIRLFITNFIPDTTQNTSVQQSSFHVEKQRPSSITPELYEKFRTIAQDSFQHYMQHVSSIRNDISLHTVYALCNDQKHWFNPFENDPIVDVLANVFNSISKSERKLHKCYDCGTVARAIFLRLIYNHRYARRSQSQQFITLPTISPDTDLPLTQYERSRIRKMYRLKKDRPVPELKNSLRQFQRMKEGVQILSIGYGNFGHIWVIEKLTPSSLSQPVYRIYQSSLRSYLLVDFLYHMNYVSQPTSTIHLHKFYSTLETMLYEKRWTSHDTKKFIDLFKFKPPIEEQRKVRPGFGYTWIEYHPVR